MDLQGENDEGTTIDHDEPFVIKYELLPLDINHTKLFSFCPILCFYTSKFIFDRIECDEDGWLLQVNDEPTYGTFFHLFANSLIQGLIVKGKADISYIGFGPKGDWLSLVLALTVG